jgi:hypothetical protein
MRSQIPYVHRNRIDWSKELKPLMGGILRAVGDGEVLESIATANKNQLEGTTNKEDAIIGDLDMADDVFQ